MGVYLLNALILVARYFQGPRRNASLIQVILWFTAVAGYLLYASSQEHENFLLQSHQTLMGVATMLFSQYSGVSSTYAWGASYSLPTALRYFDLDPILQDFASCPSCFKLHEIDDEGDFEDVCTYEDFEGNKCRERLGSLDYLKDGSTILRPRQPYQYQSLKEWLGKLLSRPGIEQLLECEPRLPTTPGQVNDIWEAEYVHQLQRNGSSFWDRGAMDCGSHEVRLLFALAIDWFNAHHSPAGKKSWEVGSIFLVCLNLPPHLRFRQENICLLGVIPGPHKPSTDEINHFLWPLVEELLQLWSKGVWYTRTADFPTGRLVRGALGPVVCDLPAIRPVVGFMAFNAIRFCCWCLLNIHDLSTVIKYHLLPLRTESMETHRRRADEWLGASKTRRESLEREHGIRWSALLDLPYWNPIECAVLDLMHNGYLGNFRSHIREVWQQDIEKNGGPGSVPVYRLPPDALAYRRGKKVLESNGGEKAFKLLDIGTLDLLCRDHNLLPTVGPDAPAERLIGALLSWVGRFGILLSCSVRSQDLQRHGQGEIPEPDPATADDTILWATPLNKWEKIGIRTLIRVANRRLIPGQVSFNERRDSQQVVAQYLKVSIIRVMGQNEPRRRSLWFDRITHQI